MKIRTVPDPVLRQKSKPVTTVDKKIRQLAEAMMQIMVGVPENGPARKATPSVAGRRRGVGLSAVQVGQLKRLFVVWDPETEKNLVFLNPVIFWRSKKQSKIVPGSENKYEGCLSVPGWWGLVKRPITIKISYQDLNRKKQKRSFTGFLGRVIQHEMDHLNGVLFIDRILAQKGEILQEKNET